MLKTKLCYKNEAGNKNRTLTLSVVGGGASNAPPEGKLPQLGFLLSYPLSSGK